MRKKKHFYTVVCLIAGVILLTTAAAANYGNANGYPMYKSAIKRILYEDNYTASLKLELLYNGETTISSQQTYMLDAKGEVVKYDTNESTRNSEFDHYYESWTVRNTASKEGEPKYLSISRNRDNWSIYPSYGEPWNNPAEDELTSKTIRFVELLADTFIGDIKNNFVQTSNAAGLFSPFSVATLEIPTTSTPSEDILIPAVLPNGITSLGICALSCQPAALAEVVRSTSTTIIVSITNDLPFLL
jgi:hypothetical protein